MIRILLIADTHLGFDLPSRPRIDRRRRGHDFFANYEKALEPALRNEVDLVVHGGDLLFRRRVPVGLVERAMAPLIRVAETGIPVYLVPGNHEGGRIPHLIWSNHPGLHIFDRPRTFVFQGKHQTLALAGFPFVRKVRPEFKRLVSETGFRDPVCDTRILCTHLAFEGAQVGASDFTFRYGVDVVRGAEIPAAFSAVLSGHIHRAQVLRQDLSGRALGAPVIYPGSVERTSFAERYETKGYVLVELDTVAGVRKVRTEFVDLCARPMFVLGVGESDQPSRPILTFLAARLAQLPPDAVVQIRIEGLLSETERATLTSANLRALAPHTMNVSLAGAGPGRRS